MNDKINNKLAFKVFAWINFFLTTFAIAYFIVFIIETLMDKRISLNSSKEYVNIVIIGAVSYIILRFLDYLIKPSYFEATINFGQINITSFTPNNKNGFKFILIFFYNKYLTEHVIERQSYTDYRILIERFGFKKSLFLQKTENGILFESSPINISLLGVRKYTNLILAIDRLKEKFSLN
jgi:hypothetical protein